MSPPSAPSATVGRVRPPAGGPDPRIAARRQQVEGERRRRLRRRLAAVLVVASLVGVAVGLAYSPLLDTEAVVVTGVADPLLADAVVVASGVQRGEPLVLVDLGSVERQVEGLAWVASASAGRSWPAGTVEVSVTPRVAVAVVPSPDGRWVLVDRSGQAIAESPDAGGVPVIGGVSIGGPGERLAPVDQPLVSVAAALTPGLATRVSAIRPGPGGETELDLGDGAVAVLGQPGDLTPEEVGLKLRTIRTVLATVDLDCLQRIDVRVSDTAVLTRNPSCA